LTATSYDHQKTTNSLGNATIDIDTGWYYIFVEATGLNFSDSLRHITGADSILMSGTGATIVIPTDPALCAVYGTLKDNSNNPIAGATITLTMVDYQDTLKYGGVSYKPRPQPIRTATNGAWQINVIPNATLDAKSKYIYKVEVAGLAITQKKVTIPQAVSVEISTLVR
jgi:hypothetical protein